MEDSLSGQRDATYHIDVRRGTFYNVSRTRFCAGRATFRSPLYEAAIVEDLASRTGGWRPIAAAMTGQPSTLPEHMPSAHRARCSKWTRTRLIRLEHFNKPVRTQDRLVAGIF